MTELNEKVWIDETINKIREKMAWVCEKNKDKVPYTTNADGSYNDMSLSKEKGGDIDWWTNGFWGGIMWLLYHDTKDHCYKAAAEILEKKLQSCLMSYSGLNHDVGFMYMLTAVADYRFTGKEESLRDGMHAAGILAGRFNPAGEFIRAWNVYGEEAPLEGWAIIDCLMNLSLLYWASKESNDPRFKEIAVRHADMAKKCFVRADGSVKHIIEFDPNTGEYRCSYGGQGYKHGSSWARGQGWAVYGFIISYIHTGKQEYLDAAKKVSHYCIACIQEDGLIPIDFRQPADVKLEDSCGACIIASGLLEVSKYVSETEQGLYRNAAVKILRAISQMRADWTEKCDAIVKNCSVAYHDNDRHIPLVYADYFFIESMYKLKGDGVFMW